MRVLVEVVHPAHVLFFLNPIRVLQRAGHEVIVAAREKDVTMDLLNDFDLPYRCLSQARTGLLGLASELIARDVSLFKLARSFQPHVMVGFGGVSISHVGAVLGIPAIGFYDTDHALLQQRLTLPFITHQYVPEVYDGPELSRKVTRFRGIKSLSYLHPRRFEPDRDKAIGAGLDPSSSNFLLRIVNWNANHDLGRGGWTVDKIRRVVAHLSQRGRVHISAEGELPEDLQPLAYLGKVADFHHFLAYCDLYVGESATVATEAFLLGVPAIYAIDDRRSYIDDLAKRGLMEDAGDLSLDQLLGTLDRCLMDSREALIARRDSWLATQIDVVDYIVEKISQHAKTDSRGEQGA